MNNSRTLLRALMLSTSRRNTSRYSMDKKKRRRAIGGIVGKVLLCVLLMAYSVIMTVGYGMYGIIDATPDMCALMISLLAFILTLFKTNGYLFNFKEYDMLMSLPFEARTIAACKFLTMYLESLPWYLSLSVAMLGGYGYFAKPAIYVYPIWIVLTLFLPLIPMLLAAFFGFIFTRISAGFRKRNIIQTVLIFIFILFCFSLRFIIEDLFKEGKVQVTLEAASQITADSTKFYPPAHWFTSSVLETNVLDIVLLIGVSVVLFLLVFAIVGRSYRNINSALKSHAAARQFKMSAQKQRSVVWTIVHKEFKRMTSSSNYMVNAMFGVVLCIILGVVMLVIGYDRIIGMVTNNAPFDHKLIFPSIPFIVHFFIGMVSTTAITPSLEGKNYWIMKSLPLKPETIYKGKMLFNLCISVPPSLLAILCVCISAHVPVTETAVYMLMGVVLCSFATTWGCVCGIKHMNLDWENELEVIKKGTAVAVYLLPNMFAVMALAAGAVFLGMHMDHHLLAGIVIVVVALLSLLCYRWALSLARRKG